MKCSLLPSFFVRQPCGLWVNDRQIASEKMFTKGGLRLLRSKPFRVGLLPLSSLPLAFAEPFPFGPFAGSFFGEVKSGFRSLVHQANDLDGLVIGKLIKNNVLRFLDNTFRVGRALAGVEQMKASQAWCNLIAKTAANAVGDCADILQSRENQVLVALPAGDTELCLVMAQDVHDI